MVEVLHAIKVITSWVWLPRELRKKPTVKSTKRDICYHP